jgi:Ras-related protein Rab-6A
MIGNSGVGKTNIVESFVGSSQNKTPFENATLTTLGIASKVVQLGDNKVFLNVHDTAGTERYRSLSKMYVRDTNVLMLVFDISNRESFENCDYWLKLVRTETNGKNIAVSVLVGNKLDLDSSFNEEFNWVETDTGTKRKKDHDFRQVSFFEAQQFAQKNNMIYMEVSAIRHHKIEELFLVAAKHLIDYHAVKKCKEKKSKSSKNTPTVTNTTTTTTTTAKADTKEPKRKGYKPPQETGTHAGTNRFVKVSSSKTKGSVYETIRENDDENRKNSTSGSFKLNVCNDSTASASNADDDESCAC